MWLGNSDGAHRQLAGGLDLMLAEKSERARMIAQMRQDFAAEFL
jgi:hypothetical protein